MEPFYLLLGVAALPFALRAVDLLGNWLQGFVERHEALREIYRRGLE